MQRNTVTLEFVWSYLDSNQSLLLYLEIMVTGTQKVKVWHCTLRTHDTHLYVMFTNGTKKKCVVVNTAGEILLLVCVRGSLSVQPQHCWYAQGINYEEGGDECSQGYFRL